MEREMQSTSITIGKPPTEMHGVKKQGEVELHNQATGGEGERTLNANLWLPQAAKHYQISPDLSDYILVPVPSLISDLPNTNGDSVTTEELMRFQPDQGQLAYETWRGKPTFVEHDNKDITKAKGVILDVYLRKLRKFRGNHVKVIKLLAFDRTKDSVLCNGILNRQVNTYSLGMNFGMYQCSYCGNYHGMNHGSPCLHTRPRKKTYRIGNDLVYRKCMNIIGFETSAVADPAYTICNSDIIMNPGGL